VLGDTIVGGCSTLPARAGYPLVSVPCCTVQGPTAPLPVGLALTATAWSEPVLLRIAAAYEAVAGPAPRPTGLDVA
jgi:amidase